VAPVLIREITRRVNLTGIFQAVYTAGVVIPKPITTCRYWHRSLNPKKLIETKFSHLTRNMTLARTIKLFRLPAEPKSQHLRQFAKKDVPEAHRLFTKYIAKFKLYPVFSEEEFEHWFLPQKNIIDSYVVEKDGVITDLISFYSLPSTVVNNPMHKSINAAYAFYNVATSMSLQALMTEALILARNNGFDVFNALDLMDNKQFLEPLKFGVGDGNLQYYLYNWKCTSVEPSEIGLVLQ
jgi:glycylpeptide N-tetradecanoyltransferase